MKIKITNSSFSIAKLILENYGSFGVSLDNDQYGVCDMNGYAVYAMDSANTETYITNPDSFMINDLSGNTPVSLSRLVKALKKQTV